jgi:GDPmannose 4,6-dehydratase
VLDRVTIRAADLLDQLSLLRLIDDVRPHELYNLAAMSFVPASWEQPILTGEFNAQGVTRVLEAVRQVDPSIRVYQASSSEMFGQGPRGAAERADAVLPAQPAWRIEGLYTTSR